VIRPHRGMEIQLATAVVLNRSTAGHNPAMWVRSCRPEPAKPSALR
jgi:hypothetical protein